MKRTKQQATAKALFGDDVYIFEDFGAVSRKLNRKNDDDKFWHKLNREPRHSPTEITGIIITGYLHTWFPALSNPWFISHCITCLFYRVTRLPETTKVKKNQDED